jgi:hypothetical protein
MTVDQTHPNSDTLSLVAWLVAKLVRVIVSGESRLTAVTRVPTSGRAGMGAMLGRKRGAMADLVLILILFSPRPGR